MRAIFVLVALAASLAGCATWVANEPASAVEGGDHADAPSLDSLPMGVGPVTRSFEAATRTSTVPLDSEAEFEVIVDEESVTRSVTCVSGGPVEWKGVERDTLTALHEASPTLRPADLPMSMRVRVVSTPPTRVRGSAAHPYGHDVLPRAVHARIVDWRRLTGPPAQ